MTNGDKWLKKHFLFLNLLLGGKEDNCTKKNSSGLEPSTTNSPKHKGDFFWETWSPTTSLQLVEPPGRGGKFGAEDVGKSGEVWLLGRSQGFPGGNANIYVIYGILCTMYYILYLYLRCVLYHRYIIMYSIYYLYIIYIYIYICITCFFQ